MKQRTPFVTLAVAALLALAAPAFAGGWGVVTLDALPERVVAGEPFTVRFMVRQHGTHPVEFEVTPRLTFTHALSRDTVVVDAALTHETAGHFAATITLPHAGDWEWTADAFGWGGLPQPMPALTVAEAAASSASRGAPEAMPVVGVFGLAAAGFGLVALIRTRRVWARLSAGAMMLGAAMLAIAGFALPAGTPQPRSAFAATPAQQGQALFLAKGCVMCHSHATVRALRAKALGEFNSFSTDRDLTNFTATPEYLRAWLTNPKLIKPETLMPKLDLSAGEIDALIAFLSAEQ